MFLTCRGRDEAFLASFLLFFVFLNTIRVVQVKGHSVRLTAHISLSLANLVLHCDNLWLTDASSYCVFFPLSLRFRHVNTDWQKSSNRHRWDKKKSSYCPFSFFPSMSQIFFNDFSRYTPFRSLEFSCMTHLNLLCIHTLIPNCWILIILLYLTVILTIYSIFPLHFEKPSIFPWLSHMEYILSSRSNSLPQAPLQDRDYIQM